MAGDTRGWAGRHKSSPGRKRKIHRLPDGSLLGVSSGIVGMADAFAAWMKAGGKRKDWTESRADDLDLSAILVKPNGDMFVAEDSVRFTGPIRSAMHAVGSGSDYALGAMMAGKSAAEAVRIACAFDPYCALPVTVLKKVSKHGPGGGRRNRKG